MPYTPRIRYGGELKHYRTKGSKNGIRRYQNLDGSLTAAGYARYNVDPNYQQKLEQQKRMTEQKLKQQQAQAQAQRNQPQRFQRPTQQAPKPYVSKEYQRELAYNSQKNNFSGANKSAPKPAAQRTPTTANRNSSNMAPKPYKPTFSVGGGGTPYVSEEYQRELAYNSQQNNFPNQNGNQEEDKDKGKKKAPKKPNISKPQSNEGKKKGGIGSWFSDRVNDARRAADSVGDAARGAASNVGRAASNAAKKAKEATDRAGDKAREAGGNAGNWLTDRIGDVKKAANQVGDNVRNAANRAGDKAREAGGNAGNWLTDRIGDVKKAADRVGDNVRNAANRAGDTVRNTANQVGEAVLGSESKRNEYNAKADEYARKAKNPVRSMGYISDTDAARPSTWFDKDAGLTGRDYSQQIADQHRVYASKEAGYRQKAKEETFKGKAEKAGRNVGNWLTDRIGDAKKAVSGAANNVSKAASDAAKKAKETADRAGDKAREAGGNAGNWLTERIGDVKKAADRVGDNVRNAANRAGDTVRNTANQVGDNVRNAAGKAKKAASDVSDWATKGRRYQAEAEKYEKKLKDDTDDERYLAKIQREGPPHVNQNALNKKAADSAKAAKSASQKASDYARSWGNNRITANDSKSLGREDSQRIGSIANKLAGDAAKANAQAKKDKKERDYWANLNRQGDEEYGNRAKAYAGRAATARQKYNNSLAGQVDKAKTAASNAANKAKDAYSNSILGKSDKAIIEGVRNAGRNVGKAASNAAGQIQTTAAESKRRAEQFIENFFGNKKKKKK